MRIVDVRGRTFDFNQPPRRVVSLVPSLTETLFDLGAGDDVAGITDFCIFPEDLDRPRVGGTNVLRDQTRYPSIDVNDINADAIFLPDEPYVFTTEDAAQIRHARVIGPFPGHLVTWHGSRTILGLHFLRGLNVVRSRDI